jgi:hypothetical protein
MDIYELILYLYIISVSATAIVTLILYFKGQRGKRE